MRAVERRVEGASGGQRPEDASIRHRLTPQRRTLPDFPKSSVMRQERSLTLWLRAEPANVCFGGMVAIKLADPAVFGVYLRWVKARKQLPGSAASKQTPYVFAERVD
jgi:hypothetical protein